MHKQVESKTDVKGDERLILTKTCELFTSKKRPTEWNALLVHKLKRTRMWFGQGAIDVATNLSEDAAEFDKSLAN
jgi:hypothetical protein